MDIRPFRPSDAPALLEVFNTAIHQLAAGDYSPEQLNAWAPQPVTLALHARWLQKMDMIRPWVIEANGVIAGYADLQADGYIDHFFVAPGFARQGVGSRLMQFLLEQARKRAVRQIHADVSLTAQSFFQRFGFTVLEHKQAVLGPVSLPNARMQLSLAE